MKKWVIILLVCVLIVAVVLIIIWPDNNSIPETARCKTDSDCVLIEICCKYTKYMLVYFIQSYGRKNSFSK